jgi:hypothetical protein
MVALKRAGWVLAGEKRHLGLGLLRLLGQEDGLDVGENTTLGNGDTGQQLVELLVVADGQLEVAGDDPGLLVVPGSIASQLKDLSSQVLHDGGHVDGGASTHTLSIVALPQKPVDTAHRELEPSTAGPGLCLSLHLASLAAARHVDCLVS